VAFWEEIGLQVKTSNFKLNQESRTWGRCLWLRMMKSRSTNLWDWRHYEPANSMTRSFRRSPPSMKGRPNNPLPSDPEQQSDIRAFSPKTSERLVVDSLETFSFERAINLCYPVMRQNGLDICSSVTDHHHRCRKSTQKQHCGWNCSSYVVIPSPGV